MHQMRLAGEGFGRPNVRLTLQDYVEDSSNVQHFVMRMPFYTVVLKESLHPL